MFERKDQKLFLEYSFDNFFATKVVSGKKSDLIEDKLMLSGNCVGFWGLTTSKYFTLTFT